MTRFGTVCAYHVHAISVLLAQAAIEIQWDFINKVYPVSLFALPDSNTAE